jgi:thymidylate kinase
MARSHEVVTVALELVIRLCEALDDHGVRYCHWKSTDAIDRSASGDNDLDLLVATDDVASFETVVHELGFIEGLVDPSRAQPGIRHFYGLDRVSGRLVDVHAHERLILGDDATKNYRLPIEGAYLSALEQAGPFPVPTPDHESAVFLVRMMLKHGSPEAIASGRGHLSRREREELRSLIDRVGPAGQWRDLPRFAPMLDAELLERCYGSFAPDRPVASRLETWRDLQRRLAPYARRSRAADVWLQGARRVEGRIRRHALHRPPRKRPADGGRVIALVGSDGSGKSTTADALEGWLSPVFSVTRIHLGKPRRSVSWLALRSLIHAGRRLGLVDAPPHAQAGDVRPSAPAQGLRRRMVVLTMRDRRRAAARARRLADGGGIVLCDRYPVSELSVDRLGDDDELPRPDLVIALRVTPEVAMRRRPDADRRMLEARAREVMDATWGPDVVVIDATLPFDDVLREAKHEIWSRL